MESDIKEDIENLPILGQTFDVNDPAGSEQGARQPVVPRVDSVMLDKLHVEEEEA